jgi:CPA1 family monovalent cation:H+ antiporter
VLEEVMEQLDQEEAMLSAFGHDDVQGYSELLTPQGRRTLRAPALGAADRRPLAADVCEECTHRRGDWVSLRMCLRCGHVACCDSSPRRHASAHYDAERHPVMRSVELGEGVALVFRRPGHGVSTRDGGTRDGGGADTARR